MTLAPGTKIGPYEIVSRIGVGGMGEVFKARDTRLDRNVAIKILPAELAQNAQFRLRFEREARTISQLSHPNICTLFDAGENYLVMELLDGETLAGQLTRGPMPLSEIVRIGSQIAEALDTAHRAGIVHRDLKPGNVMITKSGAKLLDFGLAKMAVPAVDLNGATEQKALTQEGTILGTFQYMAPEQLEGIEADARTDIFAFGALLYEMATGKRAFDGKTKTSLIAAIVGQEPRPLSEVRPLTPPALEHVIKKCLEKDPEARWQSAHDIAEELRWSATQTNAGTESRRRGLAGWLAAGLAIALGIIIAAYYVFGHRADPRVVRFIIPTTAGAYHDAWLAAPSPDGKRLVFGAVNRDGIEQLWVRNLDSLDVQPVRGTEGCDTPLFGTDPKSVLFFADNRLKKLDLDAATIETIHEFVGRSFGASINDEGTVLYATNDGIVMQRRDGVRKLITHLDQSMKEISHRWPTFLPDGKQFLYVARSTPDAPRPGVLYLASTDSSERIAIMDSLVRGVYAGGYLFVPRAKKLIAFRFDTRKGTINGDGIVVADRINTFVDRGWSAFHVTESGVLTYRIRTDETKLLWVDQTGRVVGSVGAVGDYTQPRISPDGKHVALGVADPEKETYDIWIYGLDKPTMQHITSNLINAATPIWSPDGRRLAYAADDGTSDRQSSIRIHTFQSPAADQVIAKGQSIQIDGWSPDGKTLFYNAVSASTKEDEWSVGVAGDQQPRAEIQTPFAEGGGAVSPDGRYLLFESQQSGRWQLYVRPLSHSAEDVQVSLNGISSSARWSPDGKRIYFLNDRSAMAADFRVDGEAITVSEPRQLFELPLAVHDFDVAADGRFLVVAPVEQREEQPTAVIVGWQEALKRGK